MADGTAHYAEKVGDTKQKLGMKIYANNAKAQKDYMLMN